MSSNNETTMFVMVPGQEQPASMPKSQIKAKLAKGDLRQSSLIWSEKYNEWKPASSMSQLIRPVPVVKPRVKAVTKPTGKVPKIIMRKADGTGLEAAPIVQGAEPKKMVVVQRGRRSTMTLTGWMMISSGVILVILIGLAAFNWAMVHHPMATNLERSFPGAGVWAHYGGFFQRDVLVIHFLDSGRIRRDNFAEYLVALAKASPQAPNQFGEYGTVSLNTGFFADYLVDGSTWHKLGKAEPSEVKGILLPALRRSDGQLVMPPRTGVDPAKLLELENGRWKDFVDSFVQ
jgi:hypothetical protein